MIDKAFLERIRTNKAGITLSLSEQYLQAGDAEILAAALASNNTLQTINLERIYYLGAEGVKALAVALANNRSLHTLNLGQNRINAEGIVGLAAFAGNKSLKVLNLMSNEIGTEGAVILAAILPKALVTLNLDANKIGTEGVRALVVALASNRSLQTLELSVNKIGADGAKMIATALAGNRLLHTLGLRGNEIGTEGARALVVALASNRSLQKLDLSANKIDAEGIKVLATALANNNTPQTFALDLDGNSIDTEGAKALAAALVSNNTLRSLNLGRNNIDDEGAKAILAALKNNTTLQELILDHVYKSIEGFISHSSKISQAILDEIESLLARNRGLSRLNAMGLSLVSTQVAATSTPAVALPPAPVLPTAVTSVAGLSGAPLSRVVRRRPRTMLPSVAVSSGASSSTTSLAASRAPSIFTADSVSVQGTDVEIHEEELSQLGDFVGLDDSDNASVISRAMSVSTVSEFESREKRKLREILRYHAELEVHFSKIKDSPGMKQYFWELFFYLDNIILAFKVINSGCIEGNNTIKKIIDVADQVTSGVLSYLGAAFGTVILFKIIFFAAGVVNDATIRSLARRVSRLFPDSSENGAILKVFVLFLTLSQQTTINNAPSLNSIPTLYRWYLEAMAKLSGRETFTGIDYLVMQKAEQIVKLWGNLPGDEILTVEEWLPQLQRSLSISIPTSINFSQIGRRTLPAPGALSAHRILSASGRQVVMPEEEVIAMQDRLRLLEDTVSRLRPPLAAPPARNDECVVS